LRAGARGDPARPSTWIKDELWDAACWELSGRDALAHGFISGAEEDFTRARQLLVKAGMDATPAFADRPVVSAATLPPRRGRKVPT
jgi:hypothetical protein